MALGIAILLVIQIAIGMVVSLYVTVPTDHPGSHPANYFAGSFHSVAWALSHGPIALVIHICVGLALVVGCLGLAVRAVRFGRRSVSVACVLGFLFLVGAGFNGASVLDFAGKNIGSLIMALFALAAACCCLAVLYLLPARQPVEAAEEQPARRSAGHLEVRLSAWLSISVGAVRVRSDRPPASAAREPNGVSRWDGSAST